MVVDVEPGGSAVQPLRLVRSHAAEAVEAHRGVRDAVATIPQLLLLLSLLLSVAAPLLLLLLDELLPHVLLLPQALLGGLRAHT